MTAAPTAPSPSTPNVTSAANALGSGGGSAPGQAGLAQENNWTLPVTLDPEAGTQAGSSSASTQATATAGSTNLNSVNAGSVATSGNPNTASATGATTIGSTSGRASTAPGARNDRQSIAGAGRPEDFRIPVPVIGVDLVSIRGALSNGSSATPSSAGN
ncbi:hypothetical protein F6X38_06745 [Aureimonas leprariae]|uniref:Uncharacterized protein n=1 Tax=Plantimonas leprariae TaxID=2615207 RepID=A0A7V7TXB6_9HYPH|nr:hypothetical protein F6X38_06745 [Aureimonas leprariae]